MELHDQFYVVSFLVGDENYVWSENGGGDS